eukprot:5208046-Karenia_brevis.AAC.1
MAPMPPLEQGKNCDCSEAEWLILYHNENYRASLGAEPLAVWRGSHAGDYVAATPLRDSTGITDLDQFRSRMGVNSYTAAQ